jgi:hypothetical protein
LDRDDDWADLTLKAGLGAEKRTNQFDNTTQLFHAKTSIHLASQVKQDGARCAAALVVDSMAFTKLSASRQHRPGVVNKNRIDSEYQSTTGRPGRLDFVIALTDIQKDQSKSTHHQSLVKCQETSQLKLNSFAMKDSCV